MYEDSWLEMAYEDRTHLPDEYDPEFDPYWDDYDESFEDEEEYDSYYDADRGPWEDY